MAVNKRYKFAVAFGVFFGCGFLCGFFSGYSHVRRDGSVAVESPLVIQATVGPATPSSAGGNGVASDDATPGTASEDIGLVVEEHWIDSDDSGLFIAGAVKNSGAGAFDAVRVAFDLLDAGGEAYSAVTARNGDGVGRGESWDFTIYIPYSEMDKFKSYRLQSVMGVKR
jgi:hypothetical protein